MKVMEREECVSRCTGGIYSLEEKVGFLDSKATISFRFLGKKEWPPSLVNSKTNGPGTYAVAS
jgi:hypothetical protein